MEPAARVGRHRHCSYIVAMWDHYKKTFKSMQVAIALATIVIYFGLNRMWFVAAVFFVMMQAGSLLGSLWAKRLRDKMQAQS
jgi:hypothetical protein